MAKINANPRELRGRLGGLWAGFDADERREVRKLVGSGKKWADAVEMIYARQVAEFERSQKQ